jgi:two-component system catabolic regulation response regulator CreB
MKPAILIVEDEPGIADTLQYALRTDGFEPAWCATGEEALQRIAAAAPALVILDVGLPDASGFEIFKRIRETSEIDRVVGLELGADDYIAKPFSPRELVARVRSVLRRSARAATTAPAAAAPSAVAAGPIVVDEGRMQVRYYGRALELSRYEYGLLKTLASRPGHVFTREALLDRVWGDDSDSMDRTVDAHVKTLRAKMKTIAPLLDPIRTLRGSGYALAEDLPAAPG